MAMTVLWAITRVVSFPLTQMMQAALVRKVAFALFSQNPRAFETHPANVSLTWSSLLALEGWCVVQTVECFRNKRYKPHVPASVQEKVELLVGHRDLHSHPFILKAKDWSNPKMRQFEEEGRRYESPLPLMWDIYQTLNTHLIEERSEPMREVHVTLEMAQQLRQIWMTSMKTVNVASIPDDARLVELLRGCLDKTLEQCRARIEGTTLPAKPETTLDRMWAALMRGEDPDSVV